MFAFIRRLFSFVLPPRPTPKVSVNLGPITKVEFERTHLVTHRGKGTAIHSFVSKDGEQVDITFQRKIEKNDVESGVLQPTTHSSVIKRGGKRLTSISLSLQAAEGLHSLLGEALKDAQTKKNALELHSDVIGILTAVVSHHVDPVHT